MKLVAQALAVVCHAAITALAMWLATIIYDGGSQRLVATITILLLAWAPQMAGFLYHRVTRALPSKQMTRIISVLFTASNFIIFHTTGFLYAFGWPSAPVQQWGVAVMFACASVCVSGVLFSMGAKPGFDLLWRRKRSSSSEAK